jgi:LmbE family N-acetylglucosaminyl deacetylase
MSGASLFRPPRVSPVLRIPSIPHLRRRLYSSLRDETAERATRSAVVFAPHQDDETLGCGGTMILKSDAGTAVTCVFMTDGHTSHQAFLNKDRLVPLRRSEALAATAVIGLAPDHVHFLDFPDGALAVHHDSAESRVAELLQRLAPEEVYVPYQRDRTPDHEAAYRIVAAVIRRLGRPVQVMEYPVWSWNHWPWVPLQLRVSRGTIDALRAAAGGTFGREMLTQFQTGVRIGAVLDQKRQALSKHLSQMTVLQPGTAWPTLADVSDGEFLSCLLQDFEIFRCTEMP